MSVYASLGLAVRSMHSDGCITMWHDSSSHVQTFSLLCLVRVLTLLGGRASLLRAINWDQGGGLTPKSSATICN